MNILFEKNIKVAWGYIIFVILLVSETVLLYFYLFKDLDEKYAALIGGIAASLIVAIVQFIIAWAEYQKIKDLNLEIVKFKELGVIRILENRDNEEHYREKIQNTKNELIVLGHTSRRLIEDFADLDSDRNEKKVLLDALKRGVKVKILIANKNNLSEIERTKFDNTKNEMIEIKKLYPDNFFVAYYDHEPTHSIFSFDDECFIGPMFKGLASRDTPTLHTKKDSYFVMKYFQYFEKEWKESEKLSAE